jgi:hypothetical protein
MENGCSCVHQTTHVVKNNPFPTTKTIYFAPSTTVMNGTGAKTTVSHQSLFRAIFLSSYRDIFLI